MHQKLRAGVVAVLALPATTYAQNIVTIVKAGDIIPGVGTALGPVGLAVDDNGRVLVHVATDHSDPNQNGVVVDATLVPLMREGQALSQPSGASILDFNGGVLDVSAGGESAWMIRLAGVTPNIDGIYRSLAPTFVLDETSACSATAVPSGCTYSTFLSPKINDSENLCFHGVLDDPNIAGSFNINALFKVNPTTGVQSVQCKVGDVLPGQSHSINSFEWNPENLAFNNAGQAMFIAGTNAPAGTNGVIYIDNTLVAQTSGPTPFGGTYIGFDAVDLTNNGGYSFRGRFGSEEGIVQNGAAFVQTLDTLPCIEPFALSELYEPKAGDDSTVAWIGLWDLPGGGQGRGLFIDYSLLVEEGETLIGGVAIASIDGPGTYDRSLSPSGQYFAFEAVLADGTFGAYLVDLWQ